MMKHHILPLLFGLLVSMRIHGDAFAQLEPITVSFVFGNEACGFPELPAFPEGVTVSAFTSTSVGCHAGEGHISRLWTMANTVNVAQYVGFTVTAEEGELLSFTETDSLYISAFSGNAIRIQPAYVVDGVSHVLGDTLLTADEPPPTYSFPIGESLSTSSLEIRIHGYNNNSSLGILYITEVALTLQASNIRVSTEADGLVPYILPPHVYPNPAAATATISFDVPMPGNAQLVIYDLLGREVDTLIDHWIPAGSHKVNWNIGHYTNGIYIYALRTNKQIASGKMIVAR